MIYYYFHKYTLIVKGGRKIKQYRPFLRIAKKAKWWKMPEISKNKIKVSAVGRNPIIN